MVLHEITTSIQFHVINAIIDSLCCHVQLSFDISESQECVICLFHWLWSVDCGVSHRSVNIHILSVMYLIHYNILI